MYKIFNFCIFLLQIIFDHNNDHIFSGMILAVTLVCNSFLFASAIGENVGLSLNALARLEQRAQRRPSVLEAMREQAAKAAPAKHQPEASHDRGSR